MQKEKILREFMQKVWNEKDLDSIPTYLAPAYEVYLDNADPWEGKVLNHEAFKTRLYFTFNSFSDIHFEIKSAIEDGNIVAITWIMRGTNDGKIGDYEATGKKIEAEGITYYHFLGDKICGHSQVYNRTKIMRQLGFVQ